MCTCNVGGHGFGGQAIHTPYKTYYTSQSGIMASFFTSSVLFSRAEGECKYSFRVK